VAEDSTLIRLFICSRDCCCSNGPLVFFSQGAFNGLLAFFSQGAFCCKISGVVVGVIVVAVVVVVVVAVVDVPSGTIASVCGLGRDEDETNEDDEDDSEDDDESCIGVFGTSDSRDFVFKISSSRTRQDSNSTSPLLSASLPSSMLAFRFDSGLA